MRKTELSRRRFLTAGSLGAVGLVGGLSNHLTPKAFVSVWEDATRSLAAPPFVPALRTWDPNSVTAAWLGHATVLIQFYGVWILTDPVLFRRIGPRTPLGTVGPQRLVAPALKASELPPIDLVLLSHAHLDHLDRRSLAALPGNPCAVTAAGTADLLQGTATRLTYPLRWGEKTRVRTRNGPLEVQAFEVKHWGARWRFDRYRGYNGYLVSREGRHFIFGGDTAMTNSFRDLRRHCRVDFAIMPIGAYEPWIESHCSPEQAVKMSNDANADYLLPIHFKTFAFGREGVVQPLSRLTQAMESERIGWREIGQTFRLQANAPSHNAACADLQNGFATTRGTIAIASA